MSTLRQLTGQLANNLLPLAVRYRSFFINDIPKDLTFDEDKERITSVINGILAAVVCNARDTSIRLSARKQGAAIVLEIKEAGCVSAYSLASQLQEPESLAQKIGGYLRISLNKKFNTIIAFSFPVITSVV